MILVISLVYFYDLPQKEISCILELFPRRAITHLEKANIIR
jgi:hypothetical protein